jgi:protein tyrosine phosphatase
VQLLDMYNSEKTANKVEKNPSIVHCSAGIGRTGTFIVTDMVMKMLKANTTKPPVLAIAGER